jgi:solute carrier family 25 (mitochondrial folate transporter), member 32
MRKTISDRDISDSWAADHLSGKESMIAGAGAGLISSVVTCPLDVVKTKLQAQGKIVPGSVGYKGLFGE